MELKLLIQQGECTQQLYTLTPVHLQMGQRGAHITDRGSVLNSAWCEALLDTLTPMHLQTWQCGAEIIDKTGEVCIV